MNIFNLARKYADLREDFDRLKKVHSDFIADHDKRIAAVENEIASMQSGIADELRELREQRSIVQKRRPSGRPFAELSKLAERGEAMRAEKQNA